MDRRNFLSSLACCALATPVSARPAEPQPALQPLPEGLDVQGVPGLSWSGSGPSVIEVFDYNCPYCRNAFQTLDARAKKGALRLGLIDSPMLAIGSIQAAKVRQAVLQVYGPETAYDFHRQLFAQRGAIDAEAALDVARRMELNTSRLTQVADSDEVRDILIAQSRFLNKAGVAATPAFIIGGNILSGWPGAEAFDSLIRSLRP